MTQERTSWPRIYKRVLARGWQHVADQWLDYIPSGLGSTLDSPDSDASNDDELVSWLEQYPVAEAQVQSSQPFRKYRQRLLYEALFSLTKSVYLMEGVLEHLRCARPSWTQSNAYHAAFFAAHAILALSGVGFARVKGGNYLVDVWCPQQRKGPAHRVGNVSMLAIKCGRPEHHQRWSIFQRVLRVTTSTGWEPNLVSNLVQLDEIDFAAQRNRLHYHTNAWPLPDLYDGFTADRSWRVMQVNIDEPDPDAPWFSLWLSLVITGMALELLCEIKSVPVQQLISPLRQRNASIGRVVCRAAEQLDLAFDAPIGAILNASVALSASPSLSPSLRHARRRL